MSHPAPASSSGLSDLTVPCVPTGMNAGVCTPPWDVTKRPARAPVAASSAWSSNEKGIVGCATGALGGPVVPGTGGARALSAGWVTTGYCERSLAQVTGARREGSRSVLRLPG